MTAEEAVLRAPHVLEYEYKRSVGPVIGGFMTALREGRIVGALCSGKVVVPPTEYDPLTGEACGELVEVGPAGVVTTWAWVSQPLEGQPLEHPFAWALIQLDGASTSLLHAVDAGDVAVMSTGMRVVARFREQAERRGHIRDIECFVPEGSA